jgi:hypothetical protein
MRIKSNLLHHFGASLFGLILICCSFGQAPEQIAQPEESKTTAEDPLPENTAPILADKSGKKPAVQQTSGYKRPSAKKRFKLYKDSMIGPLALVRNAASAGISTFTNTPEEWEKNGKGFGKRLASEFGKSAIKNTTIYGLDEALKLDSNFYPSRKRNVGARIKHAVLSAVTALDKKGKKVVGIPRIVGAYGSAVIARETWYPKRYGYKDGLKSGTITLGVRAAINIFKEFF